VSTLLDTCTIGSGSGGVSKRERAYSHSRLVWPRVLPVPSGTGGTDLICLCRDRRHQYRTRSEYIRRQSDREIPPGAAVPDATPPLKTALMVRSTRGYKIKSDLLILLRGPAIADLSKTALPVSAGPDDDPLGLAQLNSGEPWFRSPYGNLMALLRPPRLAPLAVTSKPVAVKDILGPNINPKRRAGPSQPACQRFWSSRS
jgi:hypothetical protein